MGRDEIRGDKAGRKNSAKPAFAVTRRSKERGFWIGHLRAKLAFNEEAGTGVSGGAALRVSLHSQGQWTLLCFLTLPFEEKGKTRKTSLFIPVLYLFLTEATSNSEESP